MTQKPRAGGGSDAGPATRCGIGANERAAWLNNGCPMMFRLVGRPRYMRAWLNDAKAIVNGEL
jgi:hypothetical protein